MNHGQFREQVAILRHLIEEQSRHPDRKYIISRRNDVDNRAAKKFHAYLSQVFSHKERGRRLTVLSILLGRGLNSTNLMTLGEVFGFLSWLEHNGIGLDTLTWAKDYPSEAARIVQNLDAGFVEEAPPYVEDTEEAYGFPF